MLGAFAGDIIGSIYEHARSKRLDFPLFSPDSTPTDDTILTAATADALLSGKPYAQTYQEWARRHPNAGYGGRFLQWMWSPAPAPYQSFGNGSAMRVSPVGWLCHSRAAVLAEAAAGAACTHDHPEGIRGAQAVALAVFLARQDAGPDEVRRAVEALGYDLSRPFDEVRAAHEWDVTCQGSVPPAIQAALVSVDFEEAIRNAVSLGGDADTQAAIAGAIAEGLHGGVPAAIAEEVRQRLPMDVRDALRRFDEAVRGARGK